MSLHGTQQPLIHAGLTASRGASRRQLLSFAAAAAPATKEAGADGNKRGNKRKDKDEEGEWATQRLHVTGSMQRKEQQEMHEANMLHTAQPLRTGSGSGPYSATVSLPTSDFNLRANSVVREPQIQAWWEEQHIYEQLLESNPGVSGQRKTILHGWK